MSAGDPWMTTATTTAPGWYTTTNTNIDWGTVDPNWVSGSSIKFEPIPQELSVGAVVYIEKKTPVYRSLDAAMIMAKLTKTNILVVEADGTITLVPPQRAKEFMEGRKTK